MPFRYCKTNSKAKQGLLEKVLEQTEKKTLELQIQGQAELVGTVTERLFRIWSCTQTPLLATKAEHFSEPSHFIRVRPYLV